MEVTKSLKVQVSKGSDPDSCEVSGHICDVLMENEGKDTHASVQTGDVPMEVACMADDPEMVDKLVDIVADSVGSKYNGAVPVERIATPPRHERLMAFNVVFVHVMTSGFWKDFDLNNKSSQHQ